MRRPGGLWLMRLCGWGVPMADLRHRDSVCEVWEGDAREVAAGVALGSCSLAILDGAYGYSKADWDRVSIDDLADWYRPHFEDVDRVCAPSASLYVWNTAAGWARLDAVLRSMGWTFRALVVWDKLTSPAAMSWRTVGAWMDFTEVAGFYVRGAHTFNQPDGVTGNVWKFSTKRLGMESLKGSIGPARFADRDQCAQPVHPCQKPVLFARRMIEASTRPGESVWVPFGGTLRECVAARDIARDDPEAARYVIAAELNQDGPDYIGAALRQYRGQGVRPVDPRQALLFGAP
jgi:hypothetical protein